MSRHASGGIERPALITGGAGFVATNVADRLLSSGRPVIIFDNLSRAGVEHNLRWLKARHGPLVQPIVADTREVDAVREAVARASQVFHFAAQVAVTTSLVDPFTDFEVNARGTLNVLEAMRALPSPPSLLFTSTNKVYGDLADVALVRRDGRYEPKERRLAAHGIGEDRPLDFHSPYGCSKGAAEQYVLDYARTFGLRTAVFRMSCIYGPHQFGTEDQGWVAHFLIRAIEKRPVTIYGDGCQVRDILFVEDLVEAMLAAHDAIDQLAGQPFNIGGGPRNTISLNELLALIERLTGCRPAASFDAWRTADQRYYVSDVGKFERATGWSPKVGVNEGIERLYNWLIAARAGAERVPVAPAVKVAS
jgi:CDP-paratose 2-epimerase